ncbi:MAG: purine-binding chemotaxis protein CheW [Deltaproteobacteria bacterium]|nr:purine-binding chemotaxis protein CheW [Deltaproteobacteria bacterium]
MSQEISAIERSSSTGFRRDVAGKYLTFLLGGEVYGLEILKVQEIIGIIDITRVPRMPDYMLGVINLRGKVLPVLDLRLKFSMEQQEATDRTCIIVAQVSLGRDTVTMGIVVDEVSEVLDISHEQIEPPPSIGTSISMEFILGMGKVSENVVMMLDIDKVFSKDEVAAVASVH